MGNLIYLMQPFTEELIDRYYPNCKKYKYGNNFFIKDGKVFNDIVDAKINSDSRDVSDKFSLAMIECSKNNLEESFHIYYKLKKIRIKLNRVLGYFDSYNHRFNPNYEMIAIDSLDIPAKSTQNNHIEHFFTQENGFVEFISGERYMFHKKEDAVKFDWMTFFKENNINENIKDRHCLDPNVRKNLMKWCEIYMGVDSLDFSEKSIVDFYKNIKGSVNNFLTLNKNTKVWLKY